MIGSIEIIVYIEITLFIKVLFILFFIFFIDIKDYILLNILSVKYVSQQAE